MRNEISSRTFDPMRVQSFGVETSEHTKTSEVSYTDAFKKLIWLLLAALFTMIVLLGLLLHCATRSCKSCPSSSVGSPAGMWVYDDAIVGQELTHLQSRPTFSHTGTLWFAETEEQEIKSSANKLDEGNYSGPGIYPYKEYGDKSDVLPYTNISDNTQSIASFADIIKMEVGMIKENALLVDIGGGKYDETKTWVQKERPDVTMLVADPFNREAYYNKECQRQIERDGGADVATSHSVLNVVKEMKALTAHVWLVYSVLKPGGLAIFKVWAGIWPQRGTRVQEVSGAIDEKDVVNSKRTAMSQNNAFVDAYKPLIEKVFGKGNVFADANLNVLVAHKPASAPTPV